MASIWHETTDIPAFPALENDMETEAVVIGGGLAGILTAYFLRQRGVKTIVLEASRIGSGQTGNTTAKITSQHGMRYESLIHNFGRESARLYAAANEHAIERYRQLIEAEKIECMFEEKPAYLYSTAAGEPLRREAEAARALGIDACFTTKTALPFPVQGAVRFERQAQFHPLAFLQAIASKLTVFEQTPVTDVEENRVIAKNGTVKAKHIVFATHFPFINAPGYYFIRMHQERSYVLALENAVALDGMYLGTDADGLSLRNSGELLLLGGSNHRAGENSAGGRYRSLHSAAKALWPASREAARWSAQDCMPMDAIPYIGRYASGKPNWYVATGFGKWGMTGAMVSAMILSDQITGHESPYAEIFSPERFALSPSFKNLMTDGKQSVKGLAKSFFSLPEENIAALPNGHGGIVEVDGEKMGVYKDENGKAFIVSVRCPHLGCQLSWNPDEKSWDCPCHGSRFDYRGNLLDNPAQEGLAHA